MPVLVSPSLTLDTSIATMLVVVGFGVKVNSSVVGMGGWGRLCVESCAVLFFVGSIC